MKIEHTTNENDLISIILEDGSICELTRLPHHGLKIYGIIEKDPDIFFFNRLKVNCYNEGRGSFLMTSLIKILDERKIAVFNPVSPYGPLNLTQLINFFKKYDFEVKYNKTGMYRKPQSLKLKTIRDEINEDSESNREFANFI